MSDHQAENGQLTADEREALGLIVVRYDNDDQSLTDWEPCAECPGGPCPCSGRPFLGSEMAAAINAILRERMAQAWDEGFDAGEKDVFEHERTSFDEPCIENPYRVSPPGITAGGDTE